MSATGFVLWPSKTVDSYLREIRLPGADVPCFIFLITAQQTTTKRQQSSWRAQKPGSERGLEDEYFLKRLSTGPHQSVALVGEAFVKETLPSLCDLALQQPARSGRLYGLET
jgi:hypothetical protein